MAHTLKGGASVKDISMSVVYAILKEGLQRDALFSKQEVITINKKIETLVKKRDNLLDMRTEAEAVAANRSKRRLKAFYLLVGLQMAFT